MYVINKPIFHPILESGKSIIVKREHMEQHALIVENLEGLSGSTGGTVGCMEDDFRRIIRIYRIGKR